MSEIFFEKDSNGLPMVMHSESEFGEQYHYTLDIKFVGNWREGLRKAFEEEYFAHILKCIKIKIREEEKYGEGYFERVVIMNIKDKILTEVARTMSEELSGDMKIIKHIFADTFHKEDIPKYLKMLHDLMHQSNVNLYQKAKVKFLIQTIMDKEVELGLDRVFQSGKKDFPDSNTMLNDEMPF